MAWSLFRKKYAPNFDDKARENALEVRRQNAELRRIEFETKKLELERKRLEQQYEVERLRYELYGEDDEEEGLEAQLMQILQPMLLQKFAGGMQQAAPVEEAKKDLTDDEILKLLNSIPLPLRKTIRTTDKEQALKIAADKFPQFSRKTFERAWELLQQ